MTLLRIDSSLLGDKSVSRDLTAAIVARETVALGFGCRALADDPG